MAAPLAGIKILDFSTLLPGPMASLFLAEAGAEVIKIERPGRGDEIRTYEPKWGEDSVSFAMLNRGKKSLALHLKDPIARDRLEPLIRETDVVIEQFRPGVMSRLGLGYDDMRKVKSDIIYCAITGYGQTGSKRDRAGHDLNYIGDAGLLALGMGDQRRPVVPPALIADIAGGAYPAVMNILLALRNRDLTGDGVYLDISMTDNLFPDERWPSSRRSASGKEILGDVLRRDRSRRGAQGRYARSSSDAQPRGRHHREQACESLAFHFLEGGLLLHHRSIDRASDGESAVPITRDLRCKAQERRWQRDSRVACADHPGLSLCLS